MPLAICWLIQNLPDVPDKNDWLSPREHSILSGLHVPKRRNDWRLGRWTAKQACRIFKPDLFPDMTQMEIIAADDGGPDVYFAAEGRAPVSLSISHSNGRGMSAVALDGIAVGCDLERIETKSLDFFEDYFTPEEISFCSRMTESFYPVACYLVWSAKESCLKVLREGLRRDTRSIRIEAQLPSGEGAWARWTGHCRITSRTFYGFWKQDDGFMYAIGSENPDAMPRELQRM
jgi:4'-phosphopantetheinyl transferase